MTPKSLLHPLHKIFLHQFAWKVLGAVLVAIGRKSEAVDANQTAVALSPQDAAATNLGNTLPELGTLEGALASFNQAIALKPTAKAHSNLVTTKELGDEEAVASYTQAITLRLISRNPQQLGHHAQRTGKVRRSFSKLYTSDSIEA